MDTRSLLRFLFRPFLALGRRLPVLVRRLWVAGCLHALAVTAFGLGRGSLEHWPGTVLALLLASLLLWVVPKARTRCLARVGEALVVAGSVLTTVLVSGLAAAACVRIALAVAG